ncbi:MAG TPA: hypothetical protein VFZ62_04120 [Candidatus Saccharimonadales bacterium]
MQAEQRASKKQRELFNFIDGFIKGNGYGPSYREVMRALDYKSVSTVAVHIDGLIARGLLRKRDNSARSLEVVNSTPKPVSEENEHVKWLKREIKKRETSDDEAIKKEAAVLKNALDILDKTSE